MTTTYTKTVISVQYTDGKLAVINAFPRNESIIDSNDNGILDIGDTFAFSNRIYEGIVNYNGLTFASYRNSTLTTTHFLLSTDPVVGFSNFPTLYPAMLNNSTTILNFYPIVVTTFALTTDTGSSNNDGITNNGEITVSGLETGATWQYSLDGGTNSWTAGTGTSFTLNEGTYAANSVQVRQTDVAGNISVADKNAADIIVDTTAPVFTSATVNATSLVLTYDESQDATNIPVTDDFVVNKGATTVAVSSVAVNATAKTVTLTLASAVANGDTVTVSYADPSGDATKAIQDSAGNDAVSLDIATVTNNTPAPYVPPTITISAGVTPVEGGTGTYTINLDSAPSSDVVVKYSLAGTATLSADYTLAAGTNIKAVTANTFTIAAGQTSATLNVNALTDVLADLNETVIMSLTSGSGYQLEVAASFATATNLATGSSPKTVSVGDFNGDGQLDLAVANQLNNNVSVFLRNATNTGFDAKVDYTAGSQAYAVIEGDFNKDGKLDIAVANRAGYNVSVFLNNGAGFDAKLDYDIGFGTFAESIAVGDFNNDGKLDLVTANTISNTVSVLLRNADNTGFDTNVNYATGSYAGQAHIN